jgi:hypothetical protein
MTEPTPVNPTDPAAEYTHEQYEEYLRYQEAQKQNQSPMAGLPREMLQGKPSSDSASHGNGTDRDAAGDPKAAVKETAKETAKDVKDTASAMFGEVKSAVSVASKREPYALLALASAAFATIWLVWRENDKFGAERLKLWTVFVLASVALLFAPIVKKVFRIDAQRAWQFAVGGASGLGFAWVAFLLPDISSNQAFFGTLAVAAGGLAAWTAPGRPE